MTVWCLHGAVGMADDWRGLELPGRAVKRVDLWRFLDCCPMTLEGFGAALNREAAATPGPKVLLGYSMGGRLALHALLAGEPRRDAPETASSGTLQPRAPWDAAVIVSAHPGLEDEAERAARRELDAEWAARALRGDWEEFLAEWNEQAVLKPVGGAELPMRFADRRGLAARRASVARSFIDWSLGVQEPLGGRLGQLGLPVLWCVGGADGRFRALGEQAVAALADAELRVFPGAGHRLPWESADFAAVVGEFLERRLS